MDTLLQESRVVHTTRAYYARVAGEYFRQKKGLTWPTEGHLKAVCHKLKPNAAVVDLGCGFGNGWPALRQLGVKRYVGVDFCPELIAIAKNRFHKLDFRVGDLRDLGKVLPERFDGFFAINVLQHISKDELGQVAKEIRAILKKGAVGAAVVPHGLQTRLVSMGGDVLLSQEWTLDAMSPHWEAAGFEIVEPTYAEDGVLAITFKAI